MQKKHLKRTVIAAVAVFFILLIIKFSTAPTAFINSQGLVFIRLDGMNYQVVGIKGFKATEKCPYDTLELLNSMLRFGFTECNRLSGICRISGLTGANIQNIAIALLRRGYATLDTNNFYDPYSGAQIDAVLDSRGVWHTDCYNATWHRL
jgi:hypothetical protein